MIELHLPFIPPTSNHTQKNALMGKRIIRYNTSTYNEFKQRVGGQIWKQIFKSALFAYGGDEEEEFRLFLASPHKVTINIYSPKVLTKKGEVSKTFGDVDNFIKPLLDAVYKPLGANDALIMQVTASKFQADNEATSIFWEPLL